MLDQILLSDFPQYTLGIIAGVIISFIYTKLKSSFVKDKSKTNSTENIEKTPFENLVEKYSDHIFSIFVKKLKNKEFVEDILILAKLIAINEDKVSVYITEGIFSGQNKVIDTKHFLTIIASPMSFKKDFELALKENTIIENMHKAELDAYAELETNLKS